MLSGGWGAVCPGDVLGVVVCWHRKLGRMSTWRLPMRVELGGGGCKWRRAVRGRNRYRRRCLAKIEVLATFAAFESVLRGEPVAT